jgi:hypothetical protein
MDEHMQAMNAGDLELERRFEAYAGARLSPDPAAVARIRSRVMREARFHHEAARIVAHMAPAIEARHRPAWRRLGTPLLAAGLWLAIGVGTIAAAHAGGPLYPTRLWLENAAIPASGPARVTAELERLSDRVAEAIDAANDGDANGVAAALDAYAAIAVDATAASAGDPAQMARVQEALSNHVAVLTAVAAGLTDKGNDMAAAAVERNIERAIAHNAAVLANLAEHQGGPAAGTPPADGGDSGSAGDQGGNGTSAGQGGNGQGTGGQVAAPNPSAATGGAPPAVRNPAPQAASPADKVPEPATGRAPAGRATGPGTARAGAPGARAGRAPLRAPLPRAQTTRRAAARANKETTPRSGSDTGTRRSSRI